ncbi:MAG: hypothetical protein M1814_006569 [Vezdaea aestivalis]|nr:MAG: hypothetical protein M1814_006569 [Vezdaea aestivalis]
MADSEPIHATDRIIPPAEEVSFESALAELTEQLPKQKLEVEPDVGVRPEDDPKGKAAEKTHEDTTEKPEAKEQSVVDQQKSLPIKPKMDILNLPYDLKSLILSYITRPTDMKSLCLVSREIHDIIIRQLYRRIDLDIGGATDSRLSAFLRGDNPGLKHIREVNLWLYEDEEGATLQQANYTMRLLIDLLPANTLEAFNWHEYGKFSSENFILLCKRQKRLKYIQANPMDKPIIHQLQRSPTILSNLKEADDLGLFPTNAEELDICQMMVENAASRLRELMICPTLSDQTNLNDGASEPGLITKKIFRHMLPFKNCTALRLKTLWLENVNLRYSTKSYMKVIEFPVLEFLDVRSCRGAEGLLQGMTRAVAGYGSKLVEFRLNHKVDTEQDAVSALEGFLDSFQGLETLLVVLDNTRHLPKASSITRHKKTLLTLLTVARNEGAKFSWSDFRDITSACSRLQQLAIAFPEVDLLHGDPSDEFNDWVGQIHRMPQLTTLNITTWPLVQNIVASSLPFDTYEHITQRLAQLILAPSQPLSAPTSPLFPPSPGDDLIQVPPMPPPSFPNTPPNPRTKLSVVAFGTSEKGNRVSVPQVSDDLRQMIFWRGSMHGAFGPGDQAPLAIPMKWRPLKYAEPYTDVLEYRHV